MKSFYPGKTAIIKKSKHIKPWGLWKEPLQTVGIQMVANIMENNVEIPQNIKISLLLLYDWAILLLRINPKDMQLAYQRDSCTAVCTAALFIRAKKCNQSKCSPVDK